MNGKPLFSSLLEILKHNRNTGLPPVTENASTGYFKFLCREIKNILGRQDNE
jgi:hypothetical protein